MASNPEEVPVSSQIESLSSASMSPENGKPALEELGGEVTAQLISCLAANHSKRMSPESEKSAMPHEGTKATAPTQHTTEPSETSTSQCLPNLNQRKVLDQPSPQALVLTIH